jgi:hypothetical protein
MESPVTAPLTWRHGGFDYNLYQSLVTTGRIATPIDGTMAKNKSSINENREKAVQHCLTWLDMCGVKVLRVVRNKADDLPGDPWDHYREHPWQDPETIVIVADQYLEPTDRVSDVLEEFECGFDIDNEDDGDPYYTVYSRKNW